MIQRTGDQPFTKHPRGVALSVEFKKAATCSHSRPLAKSGHLRPPDKSGHLRPLLPWNAKIKWPQRRSSSSIIFVIFNSCRSCCLQPCKIFNGVVYALRRFPIMHFEDFRFGAQSNLWFGNEMHGFLLFFMRLKYGKAASCFKCLKPTFRIQTYRLTFAPTNQGLISPRIPLQFSS